MPENHKKNIHHKFPNSLASSNCNHVNDSVTKQNRQEQQQDEVKSTHL